MKKLGRATLLAVLAAAAAAAPASASGTIGAPGVGDPFFPLGGNGGIDVSTTRSSSPMTRRGGGSRAPRG